MTPLEAKQIVGVLQTAWPNAKWPPATTALYLARLEPLDHAEAARIVSGLIGTAKWCPVIGEIEGPCRARERVLRAEYRAPRPIDLWADGAHDPTAWFAHARAVLSGRVEPSGLQLELWSEVAETDRKVADDERFG